MYYSIFNYSIIIKEKIVSNSKKFKNHIWLKYYNSSISYFLKLSKVLIILYKYNYQIYFTFILNIIINFCVLFTYKINSL